MLNIHEFGEGGGTLEDSVQVFCQTFSYLWTDNGIKIQQVYDKPAQGDASAVTGIYSKYK